MATTTFKKVRGEVNKGERHSSESVNCKVVDGKLQIDQQDLIQLTKGIASDIVNQIKPCLPKVEDGAAKSKVEDIETIKDYYQEDAENFSTVVALATAMDERAQRDLKSREDNNELMRKMRTNQNTALNAAKRFGARLRSDIQSDINHVLNPGKPSKPELRKDCKFAELMRFLFWQLPKYYVLCFLFDRHVKWFLRTMVICTFVILLTLIALMSHDLAEYRVDAEKYHLLRDWVNVDSTKAADKCFYLDGLFDDRGNNEEYIQRLYIGIRNERMRRKTAR